MECKIALFTKLMVLHSLSLLHHLCHWSILMSFCQYLNVRLTQSCTYVHAAAAAAFLKSIEVQLCSCFQTINFQFSRISPISVKKWPKDRLCCVGIGLGSIAVLGVQVQGSECSSHGANLRATNVSRAHTFTHQHCHCRNYLQRCDKNKTQWMRESLKSSRCSRDM